jgi:hypothetical protein
MPRGRIKGSKNRRTILAGRNVAAYASTFSKEAINGIVQIARGTVAASQRLPVERTSRGHWRRRRPRNSNGESEFEAAVEQRVQEELERLCFIPWKVRVAAWNHLLDRAVGKPFQSAETFDEKDLTITFKDAEECRKKLIEAGMPAALLATPEQLVDADVVCREAEEEN